MPTLSRVAIVRYFAMFAGLAVLTAAGRYLDVNSTAIALVFLIAVLFASAYWGLRYAVVLSIVATASFNFSVSERSTSTREAFGARDLRTSSSSVVES